MAVTAAGTALWLMPAVERVEDFFVINGKAVLSPGSNFSAPEIASSSSTGPNLSLSSRNDLSQTTSAFTITATPQNSFTSHAFSSSFPAANPSNETGAIVGGVVGGLAVLALLIVTLVRTWMHHKNYNPQSHDENPPAAWTDQSAPEEYVVFEQNETYEMDASEAIAELELRPVVELEHWARPHRR